MEENEETIHKVLTTLVEKNEPFGIYELIVETKDIATNHHKNDTLEMSKYRTLAIHLFNYRDQDDLFAKNLYLASTNTETYIDQLFPDENDVDGIRLGYSIRTSFISNDNSEHRLAVNRETQYKRDIYEKKIPKEKLLKNMLVLGEYTASTVEITKNLLDFEGKKIIIDHYGQWAARLDEKARTSSFSYKKLDLDTLRLNPLRTSDKLAATETIADLTQRINFSSSDKQDIFKKMLLGNIDAFKEESNTLESRLFDNLEELLEDLFHRHNIQNESNVNLSIFSEDTYLNDIDDCLLIDLSVPQNSLSALKTSHWVSKVLITDILNRSNLGDTLLLLDNADHILLDNHLRDKLRWSPDHIGVVALAGDMLNEIGEIEMRKTEDCFECIAINRFKHSQIKLLQMLNDELRNSGNIDKTNCYFKTKEDNHWEYILPGDYPSK